MAQIVDPKLAAACVAAYEQLYTGKDIAAINKAYTESVSFPADSFKEFLDDNPDCTSIKIKLGVYTPEFAKTYGDESKAGRLSAFIYCESDKGAKMSASLAGDDDGGDDNPPYNWTQLEP